MNVNTQCKTIAVGAYCFLTLPASGHHDHVGFYSLMHFLSGEKDFLTDRGSEAQKKQYSCSKDIFPPNSVLLKNNFVVFM